jgi:hypothetical protein
VKLFITFYYIETHFHETPTSKSKLFSKRLYGIRLKDVQCLEKIAMAKSIDNAALYGAFKAIPQ